MTSAAARLSPQTCFRLPHCLGRFAPCGFSRPPALRRADYRLPPVIVLPLILLVRFQVVVVFNDDTNRSASAGIVFFPLVLLLYMEIRDNTCCMLYILSVLLLWILRLLMIPA